MDRQDIMKILPHRDAMLLLDEIGQDGDAALGKYRVRGDEWFLNGHFPGDPIVPGVILCEILAQSVCILLRDKFSGAVMPRYTGMKNVRFRAPVRPGDTLETECRIVRSKPPFYFASGKGTVNGVLCVAADFSFAVMGE